jgi:lipopolysaccharide biosynthesis regulator YciM
VELILFWLLLPLAAFSGWWVARRSSAKTHARMHRISPEYLTGLNFLLNEQPDKAVELFIRMLEVDSETVETHLALGSLFRRRGEVDRAIRIHQNLIARPNLSQAHRMESLYELGNDYMRAGVLDRAESLFLELVKLNHFVPESLKRLIHIYEREHDWDKAIEVAHKMQLVANVPMAETIAHYHCELAELALKNYQTEKSLRFIKRALAIHSRNVRAQILQGQHLSMQGQYKSAIRAFIRVKNRMPEYLSEIVTPLSQCYEALAQPEEFKHFMQQCFAEGLGVQLTTALPEKHYDLLVETISYEEIMACLKQRPSLRGLFTILNIRMRHATGSLRTDLLLLTQVLQPLLTKETPYTCDHCGYSVSVLYWHCPSCHHWGTMKPYSGLKLTSQAA